MVSGNFSLDSVLFISAHAPTNLYPQAGQKIALNNLESYVQSGSDVDILAIANQAEITAASDLKEKFAQQLYTYPLSRLAKVSNCLTHLDIPLKFSSRYQEAAARKISKLLISNKYDLIHFEYSHAAIYLDFFQQLIRVKSNKTIVSIHDVVSQSFLRKAEKNPLLGIEAARVFHYEKRLYSIASELWVLSEKDRNILTSLFSIPQNKITVKPPKLSDFVYQVQRKPSQIENKSLLFWGAMDRPENEEAILTFVNKCFEKLLKHDESYKLYIVGAKPSQKVLKLANERIIVTGFVADPTPFFEKAQIGIVPLMKGAGIKLKTLEMLKAGLPVIATSVGAEGVSSIDSELVVNDNFDDWVNLIQVGHAH